ncbi:MAG: tRNA epoxyqueuosine(34) reductase QueG [Coxiella sp. (in: Bacteria)]|nr:MAG: tRNA epoxyqueuosine(34) reductase QueG [Coxiella sp. (in: g-proteobacteria)]
MMNFELKDKIKSWGEALGFQDILISDPNLDSINQRFQESISKNHHADMEYLIKNSLLRTNPSKMVEDTKSIIIARMDYLPPNPKIIETLRDKNKAYIARYALGRDYHRLIRKRLKKLAQQIEAVHGPFNWRPFADSAPVFEKPLAAKAGIGWQGKNTLIINRKAGSYFFLGVLYTSLELPFDPPVVDHCGSCTACLDICPTQAFPAPYQLDSRRCISYWTIENKGSIPVEIREKMGNRVFGCDDCQLICPWNKFAKAATEQAFLPRHQLDTSTLIDLFSWDESTYMKRTEGSALRRTGYQSWLRNLAVGLGNAPPSDEKRHALLAQKTQASELVKEHIDWALNTTFVSSR